MTTQTIIDNGAKERCEEIVAKRVTEKKARSISDRSAKDLCSAIIAQAVSDYDEILYEYFKNPRNPLTNELIKFEDFDYIKATNKMYKSKGEHIEISRVENFFDSDWFKAIAHPVGDYHPDQIRKARRIIVGRKALKDRVLKWRMYYEIFKLNGWDMGL